MSPLADRIRPTSLKDFIGQKHILDKEKILYKSIKSGDIFSMIFWGPPGSGKTTLARVIANEIKCDYLEFSAVNAKIAELKKIFEDVRNKRRAGHKKVVVFVDEIHRFNKAQQDSLLPYVETGDIILIGATTENPSFEIISYLLSRTRVFTLNQLSNEELKQIVDRALKNKQIGLGNYKVKFKDDALDYLIEGSNGDSRIILNALEAGVHIASNSKKEVVFNKKLVEEALQRRSLMYDRVGEEHYNTISAFIKSMRASNADAALYYLARMVEAGEDPLFIARRMVIFASEDIGMAQPTALVVANEVFKACDTIGYPECQINLAHGVVYLALAKKDRTACDSYFKALKDVKTLGNLPIPLNIRNAPTDLMKELGYGKGYAPYTKESLLPEKLKGKRYYIQRKGEEPKN
ncbi:AAA family ATPase [candidate division WWE3 bacterium RIFCSPHIGHO2_01_FULL_40_23]|uniref:AAA family ATPase n=1 Tax=candidate division WWE3 bacterium RIFCSPLOWO2_01_FULL_41_18 TaxID=1802625 RepID=A0A1F4VDU7_UNCKA|nr:MAG: AAA family ATPase [candidate division WWE3 bacterium RIFCSPHIGHO2_01_FULL_40_23]OGC55120.1 MAG: AAA family ATPase [candidate division WWE3 bacterium RIFCSPLOWO2_01_FULL_41_18]